MDSLDHDMAIALQIVEGVRRQCSCAYFASEVNISHSPCGNQDILYTVTVNYTENIAAVLNDTITKIFESFYEQVSRVNCSMFCSDLVHSFFTSTKTSVPATKTHLQSDLRSTPTRTQVNILPTLNAPNTQSSDSSASSLLPAVLGTLSVLVVIIAASVCVVVILLIIVRHKRRKEEPQNLR